MEPFFTWHRLRRSLLALLCLYLFSDLRGQTISLNVKDEKITKVFTSIEQQTSIRFVYTTEGISKAKNVTLTLDRASVELALEKLFAGQPLLYSRDGQYVAVKAKPPVTTPTSTPAKPVVPNEPLIIRGTIIDESQLPVAGAVVQIAPAGATTTSDESGNFSLEVAEANTRLVISRAEMVTQDVVVKAPASLSLTMIHKIGSLDETYVIAYGRSSKRLGTGTVSSIKRAEIEKQPVSNPLAALAGRVSGLEVSQASGTPGSAFTIRLRGQNSLASGNDPLIIVDGIPFPFNHQGSRTPAGVFSSPLAILNPSDIESIEVLKDADATAIYGSRGANGVIYITTRKATAGKTRVQVRHHTGWGQITRHVPLLNTQQYLQLRREALANDGTVPTQSNARDLLLWDTTRYTDWQKVLIGNTVRQHDTKIELSGGSQQTQFMLGAGFRKETTALPDDRFAEKKYSASLNISHRTQDGKIALTLSSNYSLNHTFLPQRDITSNITLAPNAPALYDSTGNLNWENFTWTNPLAMLRQVHRGEMENWRNNMSVTVKIIQGLEAKADFGYSMTRVRDLDENPLSSYDPRYTGSTSAVFSNGTQQTTLVEPQLSYKFHHHNFNGQIQSGWTIQFDRRLYISQTGRGYASDALLTSLKAASSISTDVETDSRYRYSGFFTRFTGDWKQTYLVNLTARRDGSSRYGPDNRFANFYSAGIGWIFTQAHWLSDSKVLTYGKLRMSYGTTGNDQIGDYNYFDLFSPMSNPYQGQVPFQPVQLFNPGFGWELVRKWETGVDLSLLNTVSLSVRHYRNRTDNLLLRYALPPSTGFDAILRNLPARVQNTGWEIEANATFVDRKDWTWSANFNFTVPRNKLLRFDDLQASTYANTFVIGQPLNITKVFQYEGVDPQTGVYQFTDFNRDGRISLPADQQSFLFNGQQSFGGLENTVRWKKFSLSMMWQFTEQKHIPSYFSRFSRPGNLSNQPLDVLDRWQQPGDISPVQKASVSSSGAVSGYENIRISTAGYINGSYLRLRTLYLSCDLRSPRLQKAGVNTFQLFVQGQNLITITQYRSLDPETRSLIPPVKMLTAGLQLTF